MKQFTFLIACLLASSAMAQESIQTRTIEMPSQHGSCDVKELIYRDPSDLPTRSRRSARKVIGDKEYVLWIDRITNLPEYLREFYDQLSEDIQKVLNGEPSPLSLPELNQIKEGLCAYKVRTFTGSAPFTYTSSYDLQQNAVDAVNPIATQYWDQFLSFIPYICLSINMDKPEAFWLNTTYSYFYQFGISYSYDNATKTGNSNYEISFYFSLIDVDAKPQYDIRRKEFQSQSNVQQGVNRYNAAIENIFKGYPGDGSRYDKLLYLNDWLTSHNCYNSITNESSRPDIAWSPLSALEGTVGENGPVCEGYSRAFKVLCDKKNIPCTLVSGWARENESDKGEAHMWNQVKMADGGWYAVDVTWNDPVMPWTAAVSGGENHEWFLVGSETEIHPDFTFSESHLEDKLGGFSPQGSYSWSTVSGPALQEGSYEAGSDIPEDPEDPDPHQDLITLEDITSLIDKYLAQ